MCIRDRYRSLRKFSENKATKGSVRNHLRTFQKNSMNNCKINILVVFIKVAFFSRFILVKKNCLFKSLSAVWHLPVSTFQNIMFWILIRVTRQKTLLLFVTKRTNQRVRFIGERVYTGVLRFKQSLICFWKQISWCKWNHKKKILRRRNRRDLTRITR